MADPGFREGGLLSHTSGGGYRRGHAPPVTARGTAIMPSGDWALPQPFSI